MLGRAGQALPDAPPYRQLFESLPGMFLILTPELLVAAVNDHYLRETHTRREEIIGQYVFDVFQMDKDPRSIREYADLMASFRQVLATRQPHTMDVLRYDIAHPEQTEGPLERYWQVTNSPMRDEAGELQYYIHQVVNVTEQVLSRQQLEQARQGEANALAGAQNQKDRLERFIMQAPAIIVVHSGPDFVFEKVNPRYQQVFPGRQLLGKPLLEGLPELAGTPVWDMVQHVYRTGETVYGEEVLIPLAPHQGAPLENNYYNFIYQARRDEHGQIDGIMVFAYDVTAQVEARKQVEHILDSMHQIVWTANPQGLPTYVNQHWLDYTGGSRSDLNNPGQANDQLAAYLHPDDGQRQIRHWAEHLPQGRVFELEVRVRRAADGMYRWHLNRAVPIRNRAGEITLWVGTATDIHDYKTLESTLQEREVRLRAMFEQLAAINNKLSGANEKILASNTRLEATNAHLTQVNADLDNFIYTASHDLKAPIHNIEGLMKVLVKSLPAESLQSERVAYTTHMIAESVERFKRTISHLTEVSKLQKESNQQAVDVPVAQVVEEVVLDLEPSIEAAGATIEVDVAACPTIQFSEKNARSIVYNLLSNAIKYRSPDRPPVVRVHCGPEGDFYVLSVTDNGLGLDLSGDKREKLFAMFKRLHNHVEGSGVGLYMVKRMIDNAGGRIEVESTLGEGTTFKVYFKR
jgi:PAS domain S-box-containing protein